MLELAISYWPHILGGAGAVAGICAFVAQLLQLQKLQYEVGKLKKQDDKDKQLVQLATPAEVAQFGQPPALRSLRSQVMILSLILIFVGPALLLTDGTSGMRLSPPERPASTATQHFAEAWLALLDSGKVGAAWNLLTTERQAQMTQQEFAERLRTSRPDLSSATTRRVVGKSTGVDTQTQAPFESLIFLTSAPDGSTATEVVTLYWRDGALAVSNYNVDKKP